MLKSATAVGVGPVMLMVCVAAGFGYGQLDASGLLDELAIGNARRELMTVLVSA